MPQDQHRVTDVEAVLFTFTQCLSQHYYQLNHKITWSFVTMLGPKVMLSSSVGLEPADPKLTLVKGQGSRLTHPMLITALLHF